MGTGALMGELLCNESNPMTNKVYEMSEKLSVKILCIIRTAKTVVVKRTSRRRLSQWWEGRL